VSSREGVSVNLPEVVPPPPQGAFRTGYLHQNVPGVLASVNRTLADAGVNIVGQSRSTRGEHGYVVTDTNLVPPEATLAALRESPEAVWLRTWPA
jgi:D-3-phosphoglycerate dehydrogenase / 2-oxoglutarate reductase